MLQWVQISGGPLVGRQMYIDPEVPAWKAMAEGLCEPFIFEVLDEDGGYGSMTVWDVGAFMGYHTLAFAALVGAKGRVIAFEPNLYNVERIALNVDRNPELAARISVIGEALWDQDGQAVFSLSDSIDTGKSSGSHMPGALAPENSSVYASFEQVTVNTVRADTLLNEDRVAPPSLVKIDVEGAEFMVLKGGIDLLTKVRPTLIIEVHHNLTMVHIQQLLTSLGYGLTVINSEGSVTSRCHVLAKPATR